MAKQKQRPQEKSCGVMVGQDRDIQLPIPADAHVYTNEGQPLGTKHHRCEMLIGLAATAMQILTGVPTPKSHLPILDQSHNFT